MAVQCSLTGGGGVFVFLQTGLNCFGTACVFHVRAEHTFPTEDKTWILGGFYFLSSLRQSPVLKSAFYQV